MSTAVLPNIEQSGRSKVTGRNRLLRHNKLYRCPLTPPPEVQYGLERTFILDSQAVSHISNDYSSANPKLGSATPPYNSYRDYHVDNYRKFFGLQKTLGKAKQELLKESIAGRVHDRFCSSGHGFRYLKLRNQFGSGHSVNEIRGHELFLSDPKPIVNYNGLFGYRRNTPSLRRQLTTGTQNLNSKTVAPHGRYSAVGCGRQYRFHCSCKFDEPCRCHNQKKRCHCFI